MDLNIRPDQHRKKVRRKVKRNVGKMWKDMEGLRMVVWSALIVLIILLVNQRTIIGVAMELRRRRASVARAVGILFRMQVLGLRRMGGNYAFRIRSLPDPHLKKAKRQSTKQHEIVVCLIRWCWVRKNDKRCGRHQR
jgi:hypothetical protein